MFRKKCFRRVAAAPKTQNNLRVPGSSDPGLSTPLTREQLCVVNHVLSDY
jgi:hypothetical protein